MSSRSLETITQVIKDFILSEFLPGEDAGSLTDTTELITGGILDSFTTLKLTTFISETFNVDVEPHEMGQEYLNTVADIAKLIQSKS